MLFIRLCFDRPDAGDIRAEYRDRHRAYLASKPDMLVVGGPICDAETSQRKMGSFMVLRAANRDEALRFHEEDPFTRASLFSEVHIHLWEKSAAGPAL